MQFKPLKRVGEPASFKGLKGAYLVTALIRLGLLVILFFAVMILNVDIIIKLVITIAAIFFYYMNMKSLREASKEDLFLPLKKNCRKNVQIKK